MKKPKITELLIFIVATELVGALSGLLAGNSFSFYKELIKPPLSPPGWLFPVMWAILYALMGISAFIIYTSNAKEKCPAFIIYGTQLFVNFMWSIVFFRFKMLRLSVAVILSFSDHKTILQEIIQKNPEEKVEYKLVGQSGPDHNKAFKVQVRLN